MEVLIIIICFLCLIAIVTTYICVARCPFKYPYKEIYFDVSKKRSPKMEDLIDQYLIENRLETILKHYKYVEKWKNQCQDKIASCLLKKHRTQQFLSCLDDDSMFRFVATRSQTRYHQRNYIRSSYHVDVTVDAVSCSISYLEKRYNALSNIGFECTLSEYNTKNQRKLMTKALREQIAKRDNYTCQMCGKYMPDGVGLHIDHITPIAKGGKSIPSNLQVLCSKCNGKKSAK